MATAEDDLHALDSKVKQLKLDYEQYFLGTRPREPQQLRGEVQKLVQLYLAAPSKNTAQRFKFNALVSRYNIFTEHWGKRIRAMEEGDRPSRARVRAGRRSRGPWSTAARRRGRAGARAARR